ncbi:cytochrome P450, partial [Syncephalis fuscata]
EIKSVYPDPNVKITHDKIHSLPYLNAVLHESMRINPAVPHGTVRDIPREGAMLGEYFIPGGTTVLISIITLHRNKDIFPDPLSFKPERWIDSSPQQLKKMKQCFIPFIVGPRACLGRSLAWVELRLTLAELVRHFTFTKSPDNDMTPIYGATLTPKGGQLIVQPHRV